MSVDYEPIKTLFVDSIDISEATKDVFSGIWCHTSMLHTIISLVLSVIL